MKCRLENEWQRNCQMVDCAVDDNGSSAIHNTRAILMLLLWGEKKGAAVAVEITHLLVNYEPRQRERERLDV